MSTPMINAFVATNKKEEGAGEGFVDATRNPFAVATCIHRGDL